MQEFTVTIWIYYITWLAFLVAISLFGWAIVFRADFRKDVLEGKQGEAKLFGIISVRGATILVLFAFFLAGIFKISDVVNDQDRRALESELAGTKSLLESKIAEIAADQNSIADLRKQANRLVFRPIDEADIPYCDLSTEPAGAPAPKAVPRHDANGRPNLALLAEAEASTSSIIPTMPPGEKEPVGSRHRVSYVNDGWYNNCRSWVAATMPAWIIIDLHNSYDVTGIAFGSEHDVFYGDRAAKQFDVLVDVGSGDWTLVYQKTTSDPVQTTTVFTFSHPVSARRVKLLIKESTPPIYPKTSPGAVRVDELEIFGVPGR